MIENGEDNVSAVGGNSHPRGGPVFDASPTGNAEFRSSTRLAGKEPHVGERRGVHLRCRTC